MRVQKFITDQEIRDGAERVVQCVKNLPLSDFQYGLIHADVYQENLFWAKGDLLLFDANNLTPIQARLLAQRGDRIRKNQPIVDLTSILGTL